MTPPPLLTLLLLLPLDLPVELFELDEELLLHLLELDDELPPSSEPSLGSDS